MSFLLWQLADSGFPAGGFAHSGGLEAAVHHGEVVSLADVHRLAGLAVRQAGRASLPFVLAAHATPDRLPELDAFVDLVLNQPVSNRASRAQGVAFLGSARKIFDDARVRAVAERVARHGLAGHHAPVFGAVLAALDVDADTAARLCLYQVGRTITSAAVRLGVAGVFDAQRVQASLAAVIDDTIARSRHLDVTDVAQVAPLFDLFKSTQDRLY
jgi:urease accessory protein